MLVNKPLAMVMGWEEDEWEDANDDDDDEGMSEEEGEEAEEDEGILKGSPRNGMLVLRLLETIQKDPTVWFDQLTKLYPRTREELEELPIWMSSDVTIGMKIEAALTELTNVEEFQSVQAEEEDDGETNVISEIQVRLPLIVRYNCLSVETSSELFSHPNPDQGGHITLSGTALYYHASYFNHDSQPNVARWAVGDVMVFVTNQDVKQGEELCISYIESEVLCEDVGRRTKLLDMGFVDTSEDGEEENENEDDVLDIEIEGPEDDNASHHGSGAPVISAEVQEEIMAMAPLERLNEIKDLLKQAMKYEINQLRDLSQKERLHDDDDVEEEEGIAWFKCDQHQLRVLLALTYDSMGQYPNAIQQWDQCVSFTSTHLPPLDENSISMRVQAALSAMAGDRMEDAKRYADEALEIHSKIFGYGVELFRKRYGKEVQLQLRPNTTGTADLDKLWPLHKKVITR